MQSGSIHRCSVPSSFFRPSGGKEKGNVSLPAAAAIVHRMGAPQQTNEKQPAGRAGQGQPVSRRGHLFSRDPCFQTLNGSRWSVLCLFLTAAMLTGLIKTNSSFLFLTFVPSKFNSIKQPKMEAYVVWAFYFFSTAGNAVCEVPICFHRDFCLSHFCLPTMC